MNAHTNPKEWRGCEKSSFEIKEPQKTVKDWVAQAVALFEMAGDRSLPSAVRRWADEQSEAAWAMADLLAGVTPEMRAEEYRLETLKDEAIIARRTPEEKAQIAKEEAARDAEWNAQTHVYDEYGYLVSDEADDYDEYEDDDNAVGLAVRSAGHPVQLYFEMI